jgi:hypothetical protein
METRLDFPTDEPFHTKLLSFLAKVNRESQDSSQVKTKKLSPFSFAQRNKREDIFEKFT